MNEKMKMQSEWIKLLRKENEDLKKKIEELTERIEELTQENYSMREDLADATWNLMPLVDFPNSNTEANEPKSSGDKIY